MVGPPDLNLGPTDYESAALTAELQAREFIGTSYTEKIIEPRVTLARSYIPRQHFKLVILAGLTKSPRTGTIQA